MKNWLKGLLNNALGNLLGSIAGVAVLAIVASYRHALWEFLGSSVSMPLGLVLLMALILFLAIAKIVLVNKQQKQLPPESIAPVTLKPRNRPLTAQEISVMKFLAEGNADYYFVEKIRTSLGMPKIVLMHAIDELVEFKFVHTGRSAGGSYCQLLKAGRAYVVEKGLAG